MHSANANVLIVDNDDIFLDLLDSILRGEGWKVQKARDGRQAIERLASDPPDLIIADLIMPNISGEQLIEYVRNDGDLKNIPIVVISGAAKEYDQLMNLGVDGYVNKGSAEEIRKDVLEVIRNIGEPREHALDARMQTAAYMPRKVVQELLADRRKREQILQSLKEGLLVYDSDLRVMWVNEAARRLLDKSASQILNTSLENHFGEAYRDQIRHIANEVCKGTQDVALLSVSFEGRKLAVHFSSLVGLESSLERQGILLMQDITRQDRVEKELARERNLYSGIMDSLSEGVMVLGQDYIIKYVNRFFSRFLKREFRDIVGMKCHTLFFQNDHPCHDCFLRKTERVADADSIAAKKALDNFEKERYYFKICYIPFQLHDEKAPSVLLNFRDISAVERLNSYLRGSASVASMLLKDKNTRRIMTELLDILGHTAGASQCYWYENYEDDSGKIWMSKRAGWNKEGVEVAAKAPQSEDLPYEIFGQRWYEYLSDGRIISGSVSQFPDAERDLLESQDIKSILAIPLLIDEKFEGFIRIDNCSAVAPWQDAEENVLRAAVDYIAKALEHEKSLRQLRESEAKYRELFDNIYDIWFLHDMDGRVLEVNPAVERIGGYAKEEMLSIDARDFLPERHRERFEAYLNEIRTKGSVEGLVTVVTKFGEERVFEYRNWIVHLNNGEIACRGLIRDVSEKMKLQAQLKHAQRMESMGTLASGIAHNFRNILTGILTNGQLLQLKCDQRSDAMKYAGEIIKLGRMGSDLINDLLQFSRKESDASKGIVNLAEVLKETYRIVSRSFDKQIDIRLNCPNLIPVTGDRSALSQVFMNLCTNARDAMPNGGALRLEAEDSEEGIKVTISDTGSGMTESTMAMIFDPFFTTKSSGKGTGLGLSTAYGIVKNHRGDIRVKSRPGEGSSFEVIFPRPNDSRRVRKNKAAEIIKGHGEKILIVDDDETLLKAMEELVSDLGYKTKVVDCGEKAVTAYKKWHPDVILLDRNMPGMDGLSTSRDILNSDPEAKIILISGYEEQEAGGIEAHIRSTIKGYLTKPFDYANLSHVLTQVIKQ